MQVADGLRNTVSSLWPLFWHWQLQTHWCDRFIKDNSIGAGHKISYFTSQLKNMCFFFIWHKKLTLFKVLKILTAKANFAILRICMFLLMTNGWVISPYLLLHNFSNVNLIVPNVILIPQICQTSLECAKVQNRAKQNQFSKCDIKSVVSSLGWLDKPKYSIFVHVSLFGVGVYHALYFLKLPV